ncbi:hypothetical protein CVN56_31120 [Rhodococcus sp. AQ5-07]|uniref:hypothetical protein n=1 Tax=Rhodococcus sp. AQ5-07 TaxID=2054902 RepID=UPI000DBF9233|nr:hypothetical protein [Rhodococcus sp. AQ5-07]RAL30795.1 hypothetical protein CVN56_31120 [Rhodococcus sp. AQ5-07]
MTASNISFPVAVSQLRMPDSREQQSARAAKWLLDQIGGPILVVTPNMKFDDVVIKALMARPSAAHVTWKSLSAVTFAGKRVVHAWPDRQHLNDLWGAEADALVVIEWGTSETAEWIEDANPARLLPDETIPPLEGTKKMPGVSLPAGVDDVLASVAAWAEGYDSGLKWNEEDKLKADMMNRPERWADVTVEQVRATCKGLGMRPNDIDTIAGFLQRRKEGRRFNVRSSYKDFRFN